MSRSLHDPYVGMSSTRSTHTLHSAHRAPRAGDKRRCARPYPLKSEDKKVLEELGVAFCASLSDDIRHKRADAGLVKTAHYLVEQGKESVPETLRRELCMPVLASSSRRGKVSSSWMIIFVVLPPASLRSSESKFGIILLFTTKFYLVRVNIQYHQHTTVGGESPNRNCSE